MKTKIILATTSPRRHELAQNMGLEFEVIPSRYVEDMALKVPPKDLAMTLASGKANDVAKGRNEGIVIGIDTFIVFEGKVLGKPKSKDDAFSMLKSFSGKWQEVYTGVSMIDCANKKEIKDCEISRVKFREIDDTEINNYIATGEPMDRAGAYAIQGLSSIFIEGIEGCYPGVIGFPIYNIYKNLKSLGVNIFEYERWSNRSKQ